MSIKVILVPLDDSADSAEALGRALLVARRFGAHVRALHVVRSPLESMTRMTGVPSSQRDELIAHARADARASAARIRAMFEASCETHGVALRAAPGEGASAEWVEAEGAVADALVSRGRLSDVVVMPRPRKAGADEIFRSPAGRNLEAVMLGTGRPLLIVPPENESIVPPGPVHRVVIGWNESQEAARALSLAIPWLPQMEKVTLVAPRAHQDSVREVLAYLAWHGVDAEAQALDRGERSAGAALLDACRSLRADILVVGGYSHSRARQRLFGGVTRHLLSKASVITLMVH